MNSNSISNSTMTKIVALRLDGNLEQGVKAIFSIANENTSPYKEVTANLPPIPQLQIKIQQWRSNYRSLNSLTRAIKSIKVTYGSSIIHKYENCQNSGIELQKQLNNWLHSDSFRPIRESWLKEIQENDSVRVLIRTSIQQLREIPWHLWDLIDEYPNAELALSAPDYQKPAIAKTPTYRERVKILAILGNSTNIDVETDRSLLNSLPDADVTFLVQPQRHEINDRLWDRAWDILFFAGHSKTVSDTGRIYINENKESLSIDDLKYGLKKATSKGLALAIFNSCDGLALGYELEILKIPQIIVMRERVPDRVAQVFLKYFLDAFANRGKSLYQAAKEARLKLHGFEDKYPCASWLPVICQNAGATPPNWLNLGRRSININPYRGLFAFKENDSQFFFGRESFTNMLVEAVENRPLVAVIGSSGSGKSSVVFAGLVNHLRNTGNWHIFKFRPGSRPLFNLANAFVSQKKILPNLANCCDNITNLVLKLQESEKGLLNVVWDILSVDSSQNILLVVDQFEELYTLCQDKRERHFFLNRLLSALDSCPNFTIVITIRADFMGQALSYRPFADALQYADLKIGPMRDSELKMAIEKPAALLGVTIEAGLTDRIISEVSAEPGNLPLLQFALTQLWEKQLNAQLTHFAYDEIGTVEGALAGYAEQVYQKLNFEQKKTAQRIFIQLVNPGQGTEDTRRLATRVEVGEENWDLVAHLASSRLVITGRDEKTGNETVEFVHEALIRNWQKLQIWSQQDRDFRSWQEQLRAAIRIWENSNYDRGALLRGKPLADAEDWQSKRYQQLSKGEKSFIQLSVQLRQRENNKRKQRTQLTIAGLTSGLLGALILAGFSWQQWQNAAHSEIEAISASSEALYVSNNKLDALIEAIRAKQKLNMTNSANAETKTEVNSVLQQAVYGVLEYNRLSSHLDEVKSVAFSPDGKIIASASSDTTIKLWKRDGTLITTLAGHKDKIWHTSFSPDSNTIASGSKDKTIKLWKIKPNQKPFLLTTLVGHDDAVRAVAFSPDGKILASASDDRTVKLWKRDGTLITTLVSHTGVVNGVAFSPDGKILASASDDRTVKLWKRDGTLITTLVSHTGIVNQVAFSPDGEILASTSWDKTIKLWKLEKEKTPTLLKTFRGHTNVVFGVKFSPDSQTLASSSWDKTVKLWKRDGSLVETFTGHSDRVWGIAFSPDGKNLASASDDKIVKLWKLKHPLLTKSIGHTAVAIGVAFRPDSEILASTSDDTTVKLWQRDGTAIASFEEHTGQVYDVAFSPDGRRLASVSADNTVKLWSLEKRKTQLLAILRGHQAAIWGVAFSPDGQMIASAAGDNTVMLWNVEQKKPQLLAILREHQASVFGLAFSPDSKMLVSTSGDNTVKLWKVNPAHKPVLLKTFTGHTAQVFGVAFAPDGKTIASASADNTIKLWKPDGTLLNTLKGHSAVVFSVAFSPDSQIIASASWDKTIGLWKPDGTLLTTLNGYSGRFWKLAFSPDGQTIAAANEDKMVILWNKEQVLKLNPLMYACNWVSDYLKTNPNVSDRYLCDRPSSRFDR